MINSSKQQEKKRIGKLLSICSQIASQHNLNFSSQEVSKSRVIGVDGLTRKLLVAEYWEEKILHTLIDLEDVKKCAVKKNYNQAASETFLQSITLEFSFWKNRDPFEISFYDNISNHIYEMSELELKARDWEKMLTKFLRADTRERA